MSPRGGGRRAPRTAAPRSDEPTRTCIGCRGAFPRETLIRLVRGPEGQLGVDRYLRAPGRGAHLCYDRRCFEQAYKRRAFGRAFKEPLAPIDLAALVAASVEAIDARVIDSLALLRRAGRTVSGADVLERALRDGRVKLIVLATDAAPATSQRWRTRAQAAGVPVVVWGDLPRLGQTQGKPPRAAVGIAAEDAAERLIAEIGRRERVSVAA